MTDFARALPFILRAEGGYANDPDDPGGATNYGITQRAYTRWLERVGMESADVRDITPAEVAAIYERDYWLAARCDRMPWPLALIHFDAAVNTGVGPAIRQLQRALGLKDDGIAGPITLARCGPAGPRECYRYLLERVWYYDSLDVRSPKLTRFLTGAWLGRLRPLYREVA